MLNKLHISWLCLSLSLISSLSIKPLKAQTINSAQVLTTNLPPSQNVFPIPAPKPFNTKPAPNQPPIFQPNIPLPPTLLPKPGDVPITIKVKGFKICRMITVNGRKTCGSTVFKPKDFEFITKKYIGTISWSKLLELKNEITKLYFDQGYITSGAYIPIQQDIDVDNGMIEIGISEGEVKKENIKVKGTQYLNPDYIRSRIALATQPLNRTRLVEALQLLLLKDDQLIKNISAELSTGTQPGESVLEIKVTEAPKWETEITLDNGRTPSVGTFRRQFQLTNFDFLGLGDRLAMTYTNTTGSNSLDTSYTIPFNTHNGKITLSGGFAYNNVIESPYDILDIKSKSNYVELSVRQPLLQTTAHELALGLTISHHESGANLLGGQIPFPSPGADAGGTTRVTALRFFQDYTIQDQREVLAFHSQFSFGLLPLDALNATPNPPPESNFFAWRGQVQYVRLLAEDMSILLRGDIQLADTPLVPLEQFALGGQQSVRGYRQDLLLSDSGVFLSSEVKIPILRIRDPQRTQNPKLVIQLSPFVDFGHSFNQGNIANPSPNDLVSVGSGLLLNMSDRLTARFDWGIPLISISGDKKTLQEQGLYFSLVYKQPF